MSPRRFAVEPWLFAAAVAALLLPLAVFAYFPSQDGPDHAAVARVLRDLDRPEGALLREYFESNPTSLPNRLVFVLSAHVLGFLPLRLAEKTLLVLFVLGLPLAARYAATAFDPGAGRTAWLALPFVYNYLFLMGFYNFSFGLAGFLVAIGFYQRRRNGPAKRWAPALAGLALLIYLCHPVSLVATAVTLGGLAAWESWRAGERAGRRLVPLLLALLPALLALAVFAGSRAGARIEWEPWSVRLWQLAALYSLVALHRATTIAALGTAACLGFGALLLLRGRLRARRLEASDGLPLIAAGLAALDLVAPDTVSGGGFLNQRLLLFPWLVLLLWLAARARELAAPLRWAPLAGTLLAGAQLAALWPTWAATDRLVAEAVSAAPAVAEHSTLLTLSFAPDGRRPDGRRGLVYRSAPFRHLGGWIAAERRVVDLALYAAHEDYFPIRYRAARDPYERLGGVAAVEAVPPRVDLDDYAARGGRIDYVLLWQLGPEQRGLPETRRIEQQLAASYALVFTSARGNAQLFRRLAGGAAARPELTRPPLPQGALPPAP